MRIELITQGVSMLVVPLFNSGHEIVGVLESMPRNYDGSEKRFVLIDLLKIIYRMIKGRNYFLPEFCKNRGVSYNILWKNNISGVKNWLRTLQPDLIVVFSMSQLLKEDILKIPPLGVINLHPSYLPSYRGANPDFWQYYDMEMNPGATVHYLDAGEDSGDIIFQERVHIPLGTKSPARLDKLIGELGVSLVLKAVDAIVQGKAPRTSQTLQSPTDRSRNLKPEEHSRIIDWENWPIERVWHVLRGTELWLDAIPQPAGLLAGQRWSIGDFEKTDMPQGEIGKIGEYKNRRCVYVKCGVIYIGIDFDIKKSIFKLIHK